MNPHIFDLLSRGLFGQFLAGSAKVFKGYSQQMVEIRKTETFAKWIDGLSDIRARARILVRVERLSSGNPGDVKPVGESISEMRIDYGPGYRVYIEAKIMGIPLSRRSTYL